MSKSNFSARRLASFALLIVLIVIIIAGIMFPPAEYLPVAEWGAQLQSAGAVGMLAFVVIGMLATAVGLPRQLVAFIGGLAYGIGAGLLLALVAALCGCALTAKVSRRFFSKMVNSRFPKPIATLDRLIQKDLFIKILILRLQPFGTNLLTNVCIGFTRAPLPVFMLASAVGYVPQMLVFNLLGVGVRVGSHTQLVLSGVLLLISIALGFYLYKRNVHTEAK